MRERLTLAFLAVTLTIMLGAIFLPRWAVDDEERALDQSEAQDFAAVVATHAASGIDRGEPVDLTVIAPFATDDRRLSYEAPGGREVVAGGDAIAEDAETVSAGVPVMGGGRLTVTTRTDADVVGPWGTDRTAFFGTFALLALIAALAGYVVARSLSEPFRQLASAAAALGRGRFDLDLPRTRLPEVRAIATALDQSAGQLRDRLERERAFGQHASHVLRTPLTSLTLRLEELVIDDELPAEARDAARACLRAVGQLNDVAGELVELGGRGVLVADAAVPLRDLATQVAQRWADRLDEDARTLTAAVEGDIELIFTPGPVEQVLDLLLEWVVRHEAGAVRLVFEGAASRLRVDLTCTGTDGVPGPPLHPVPDRVHTVLDALGGRLEVPTDADVLRLHLPRR